MPRTICNPLDLPYRYQIKIAPGKQAEWIFREGADPTIIRWRDRFLLFASMSGGFWHSRDLMSWEFKATPELPIHDYAPDVREIDGSVVFCASHRDSLCTFYRSEDPISETFEPIAQTMEFWDPDLFQDDDGKLYLYWGCSSTEPIFGVELDRQTFKPLGSPIPLIDRDESRLGWERKGENNHVGEPKNAMEAAILAHTGNRPFIEGAYMTKWNGRYYLQFAAPGTECNVYADGVYIGRSPLGPFEYQAWNPFSSNPGGFMQAAGHGSTFQDFYGNWWHASTMRISVNENFERRIGVFPCEFDEDGLLHCDQRFACHPQVMPKKRRALDQVETPWMLLSALGRADASSQEDGFSAENAISEDCRCWWAAKLDDADPWVQIDLGRLAEVHAIQVNLADHKLPDSGIEERELVDSGAYFKRIIITEDQPTRFLLETSEDGSAWCPVADTRDGRSDRPHAYFELSEPRRIRYVRLSGIKAPMGGRAAVSGLRIFGCEDGSEPDTVRSVRSQRTEGGLSAELSWDEAAGAAGYVVRYGTDPKKLYGSWQLSAQSSTNLTLSTLDADKRYWAAVDSFGPCGVVQGEPFPIGDAADESPKSSQAQCDSTD
ncbi:glycoside hydrolase family 43 [Coriobacterium glomerans PW2]|uniref:Glycoside hydrolase family 43 n=1 Tax=Coriobacterium glomerans (strain ATCC 49209 / DSM 20642 / JCM 10262 / PW2) TaxID=700015 RepID=F2NA39_CORGP|nr:family 43 glycosylhydrolase [Coriobacterium glomerans]AEB06433.1 glycoside hydrolase family 43 [Coriobacterium glomerans PW2]